MNKIVSLELHTEDLVLRFVREIKSKDAKQIIAWHNSFVKFVFADFDEDFPKVGVNDINGFHLLKTFWRNVRYVKIVDLCSMNSCYEDEELIINVVLHMQMNGKLF